MNAKLLFAAALGLASLGMTAATPHPVGSQIMANGFTYTVAGENLITNGDFSQGLEGWNNGKFEQATSQWFDVLDGGPNGEKYINAKGDQGSGAVESLRRNIQLEPNKTYVLSFYHKGNGNSEYICAGLVNSMTTDPGAARFFQPINIDYWTQSGVAFTTTEANSVLGLKFAWLKSNFSATDFFLAEVAPCATYAGTIAKDYDQRYILKGENLIENGDFSQGYTGWMLGQYQGPISEAGWDLLEGGPFGVKYISCKGDKGSGSDFSLIKNVQLTPGKHYAFSFWYKDVVAGNSRVTLSSNVNVNNNYKIFDCDGNGNWKQKTLVFRATEANPYLVFNFAWNQVGTSFADFKLYEVDDVHHTKAYRMKQAFSGLYWAGAASGDNHLVVANPDQEGYEYVFLVDHADLNASRAQALNVTLADGRTLHRRTDDKRWEMVYGDVNRNEVRTMFNIREHAGHYFLYNHDSNNILATDNTTHDSYVYNDKGYGKTSGSVFTAPIELEEVPYAFSNRWIKEEAAPAEALYANTAQYGDALAADREELRAILDQAYDVTNCASVADIKNKVQAVKDAAVNFSATTSGITDINADTNAPVQYYDVNGRPVDAANLATGVYLLRKGNTVTKVVR